LEKGALATVCGAVPWNNLPYEAKTTPSISFFETILKQTMS
jgi:hypothetical protein